ncbi:MAG: dTDP-4-dehydrorhamnose reductase [Acidobacteria bacterium]|nr:dTDP-4-dehydrorhamnose reductase [Acidobacteriota bacterium]
MLGRALRAEFPAARAFARSEADLSSPGVLEKLIVPGVSLVLNAAADTRVDLAETDPAHRETNAAAVGRLARLCAAAGAMLVHVSTDYVFDGTATEPYLEDHPVDPVNAYGAGKLEGERQVVASGARFLIVRTSWVFGVGGANFPEAILRQVALGRTELRVVSDQRGRPTYAADLAHAIRRLVDVGATGIVHFANSGETTWFGLAAELVRAASHPEVAVKPCTSDEFPRPAKRPAYSVLDTSLYERLTGEPPPPWQAALARYLAIR